MSSSVPRVPSVSSRLASRPSLFALGLLLALGSGARAESELVFDLSGFSPAGVGGEVIGIATSTAHVVHGRIDATFVSHEPGEWSLFANFELPTGLDGVDSETLGWEGAGTFHTTLETDAFNGFLAPAPGQASYAWYLQYAGGVPIVLPGGGTGFGPVDGEFSELVLTLTVCDCPPGPFSDLGHALAGTLGEPQLTGTGNLCRSAPTSIALSDARPGGTAFLVLGAASVWLPFKGGTLIPDPGFVVLPLPIDGAGGVAFDFTFPIGLPSGLQLWMQDWIPDPAGALGFAASNTLLLTVPDDC
ncbi:MAG: hypothetical protein H6825_00550 [Planctomycetes bacterium]|nr:hypothetical protein [Planctomycetota bacterium]